MTRRMSCSMTVDGVLSRVKTVTRRHPDTWRDLKVGDVLTLIEKGMGLAKGQQQVVLATVIVTSVTVEPVDAAHINRAECRREGLAHMSPAEFIAFWIASHRVEGNPPNCRRIAWRYID